MIRKKWRAILLTIVFAFLAMRACEYFPESSFELASESRLPKFIDIPPGNARSDILVTMKYYVKPWGRTATFIVSNKKGQEIEKLDGSLKGYEPLTIPPGMPQSHPTYEIITVGGITDVIEHRKMEPIFYVTDEPTVFKELGVK